MTLSARLREEGRIAGEREGYLKAFQEGYVEGLMIQLPLRFGPLPEAVLARLRSADLAQLEIWGDLVLTAPTLDEVFDAA